MRTRRSSGPRASVSCPGRVQRARLRERNETRDPEAINDGAFQVSVNCAVKLLGPGSRFARPGHERVKSRRAKRTVGHHSRFTMSNSAELLRSRGVVAPGFCPCDRVHPPGGVGGAPTGALSLLSRLRDATDPRE